MLKTILFDLDGTLLPMDQEKFLKSYFTILAQTFIPFGYDEKKLIAGVWQGTQAMIQNQSNQTNEEVFWQQFSSVLGNKVLQDKEKFDSFYENEFNYLKKDCFFNKEANQTIQFLKEKGYRLVLATNPVFPFIAQKKRLLWAGIQSNMFEYITCYENSCSCKPNVMYYQQILQKLNCKAEECLMVGNDVTEDMVAETIGIKVFLLTDCLINKENKDITRYPHGNFLDLCEYLKRLDE